MAVYGTEDFWSIWNESRMPVTKDAYNNEGVIRLLAW